MRLVRLLLLACLLLLVGAPATRFVARPVHAAGPAFIQVASATPQSNQRIVTVAYPRAETAGNLNVVIAGWNDATSTVVSVTDSAGNTYLAASSTTRGGGLSQKVYYALGIAAGASTTVTITMSGATPFVDARILEYAGAGALDASVGAAGSGTSADSGGLTTTTTGDLLVAGGMTINAFTAAGTGYTTRIITQPDTDIAEDRVAAGTGAYHGTAPTSGGAWVLQTVAFTPGTVPPLPTPTSTPVSPIATVPVATATATSTTIVPTATATITGTTALTYTYPLTLSANNRYLVDQRGTPFLLVGDSPQSLIGNLSTSEAATYFADRQAHGFDAVWINLLCAAYTYCRADGTTSDGIAPFTGKLPGGQYDLSTPNPAYFARVDAMVWLAAQDDIAVFLDPIETGSWLDTLHANGVAAAIAYGRFLGSRYASMPNIVWLSGNDYQTWGNTDDQYVGGVADGIRATDPGALQSVELNFNVSDSLQDSNWAPRINLDAAYTYAPTYAEVLAGYNRNAAPVFMVEANYEGENNTGHDPSTPLLLRKQAYWTLLSGATGQFYGSHDTVQLAGGWQTGLDTVGVQQLQYATNFFASIPWSSLVPDQGHTLVTGGDGTFDGNTAGGGITGNDYLTAGSTPDGSLAAIYMPTSRAITVDMSRFAGSVLPVWFDPTNGECANPNTGSYLACTYQVQGGGVLANSGSAQFTPPGPNSAGDGDWVLLLETAQGPAPTVTTVVGTATPVPPTATNTAVPPTGTPTPAPLTNVPCTVLLADGPHTGTCTGSFQG